MDGNTRHIVASNLTIAFCATRPSIGYGVGSGLGYSGEGSEPLTPGASHSQLDEGAILEIYGKFYQQLGLPDKPWGVA